MPSTKRKVIEVVDLTGDEDEHNFGTDLLPTKFARPKTQYSAPRAQGFADSLPSTTSSSQPSSSRSIPVQGYRTAYSGTPTLSQSIRDGWSASTQEIDDDVRREVNISQDFDDDVYNNFELYGILKAKVVGIRYYDGQATTGEYVKVRREPRNPYDSNAIRIDNVRGVQIGHIARAVAEKLAKFMDSKALLVEGVLTGPKGNFDCPIGLKLFGSCDPVEAAALRQQMVALKLPVNEHTRAVGQRNKMAKEMERQQKAGEKAAAALRKNGGSVWDMEGSGTGRYANFPMASTGSGEQSLGMDEILSGTSTFNPRDVQDVLNKFAVSEDTLSSMEMAEQPPQMATVLLPYQRQGLKFLLDHESMQLPEKGSEDTVQLWKNSNGAYTNLATSFTVTKPPQLASGGILADDMGLGKTIQILSLIMADPHKTRQPTLILAPLSVLSNWRTQAAVHIKKKFALRVLIYHGQENRGLSPSEFGEYDIVVTTYQTLTLELFPFGKSTPESVPSKKGLFSVTWRRLVLDEGHQIRNPKAKMSQAASTIQAKSRWVLTGTPIVNSLRDLYSHVKFLRLEGGLSEFEIFNSAIIRPLKHGDPNAKLLLQALMSTLCLRRMKDMRFVDLKLPPLTFHKYSVKFLPHEQKRYDAFKAEAHGLLESVKVASGNKAYTYLLEVLLRLRQTCNHWKLCGEDRINRLLSLVEENKAIDTMDPANRRALQDLLQLRIDSQEDCPVCMDNFRTPVITACAHAFCSDCIEKVIETQHKCPMCRAELLDRGELVQPAAGFGEGDETTAVEADEIGEAGSSSKIEALVKILKATDNESDTKTVVFSQWTSFLDLVQTQLLRHNLKFVRLDGKLSAARRDAAIEALCADRECKILLASLSVCSMGLNLTAANHVILADSWWAPAIEDQAVDRIYRLGQTRECKVVRLIIEGSIEDEVLEIQAKKRNLVSDAFGEAARPRGEAVRSARIQDIERLLR